MQLDLMRMNDDDVQRVIALLKQNDVTDAEIALILLYQAVKNLRLNQNEYYRSRDNHVRALALADAKSFGIRVDMILDQLQPNINALLSKAMVTI